MRRFLVLVLVASGALLGLSAATAKAQGDEGSSSLSYKLWLDPHAGALVPIDRVPLPNGTWTYRPTTLHVDGMIQWRFGATGAFNSWDGTQFLGIPFSEIARSHSVTVSEMYDATVSSLQKGSVVGTHEVPIGTDGTFSDTWTISAPGTYTLVADTEQWSEVVDETARLPADVTSSAVVVNVVPWDEPLIEARLAEIRAHAAQIETPAAQIENGAFLCYSAFQITPGVWPMHEAQQLLAGGGYWQPYAVEGNVPYGTNVGGYHLLCNVAAGQAVGQQFAGAGGDRSGPEAHAALVGMLGWYPVVP